MSMENMTKPSVISIVPIELFTKDNFTWVGDRLKEKFPEIREAFNTEAENKTSSENGSNDKDKQAKEIQEIIKSSFSFAKDDFKIVFLTVLNERLYIEKLSRKVEVTLKIRLATQGTSLIFVAIYEPKDISDKEEELFKTMGGIREYHNDLIENLGNQNENNSRQNNEVENNEEPKNLVSYIKYIEKSCKKVSRKNCKKISQNSELWDLVRPSYTFTFFHLPDSGENCSSKEMLERARKLADAPKKLANILEELADTQKGKGQDIKFDNKCAVYVNWSKLCIVVSDKVAEKDHDYVSNVIALQIVLQMLWNRSDRFSNLIYKIVREDPNRKKCFSKRNSKEDLNIKKALGTKNMQELHLEFLTAKTNMESIASATASSKNLKLLEPFIETSRINAINTKLKNHLEMFGYLVLRRAKREYQRLVQGVLVFFAVFTATDIVFNLRWFSLGFGWRTFILSVSLVLFILVVAGWLFKIKGWLLKFYGSVKMIRKRRTSK